MEGGIKLQPRPDHSHTSSETSQAPLGTTGHSLLLPLNVASIVLLVILDQQVRNHRLDLGVPEKLLTLRVPHAMVSVCNLQP